MQFSIDSALVLAPHTDDGELGCGGTIAKLTREGVAVHYVAFSICEESVPAGFPRDVLAHEVKKATASLDILPENLTTLRYRVRRFSESRQDILEDIVQLQRTLQPDIVFLPANDDVHQDHHVISMEGMRAFKRTTILGYELPWNSFNFRCDAFVTLTAEEVERKRQSLHHYRSQGHRDYVSDEKFIESMARMRGIQAGTQYAEAFQVIRWMIR